jgi:hypothetical protein
MKWWHGGSQLPTESFRTHYRCSHIPFFTSHATCLRRYAIGWAYIVLDLHPAEVVYVACNQARGRATSIYI